MVEVSEIYDGGLYWQCPACRRRAHRWPEGHRLRERTESYWRWLDAPDEEHMPRWEGM